jgi:conjugative relaxase-like TrwC/TraI family protein
VSLLWAFGGDEVASEVSIAMVEAATTALDFMERHAAVARQQRHGIRRRVDTDGFAVAMFTHRTSRAGDPQLHVHSLVPNLVQRADGTFVAVDANPVHEWLKASGTIFQSELQRHLTDRLGVAWGPERNGCRELIGFTPEQRRAFSKRTAAIETVLEASDEAVTAKQRMRADDRASLMTRKKKDRTLTPNRLRSRWEDEAASAGIPAEGRLRRTVCHQAAPAERRNRAEVFAALVDPERGLCATRARFGHAHVVERVAALSAGRLTVAEIEDLAAEFLRTELVVRLVPSAAPGQRKPAEWSTLEHRQLGDHVLQVLADLQHRSDRGVHPDRVDAAIARGSGRLGDDQEAAVRLLCGPGAGLRVVLAPAGHGKTALTATAAETMTGAGRPVVALATTNKAVAELRRAGLDASTIVRFRLDGAPLAYGSVVIIDEVSQVSTRDAHTVLRWMTGPAWSSRSGSCAAPGSTRPRTCPTGGLVRSTARRAAPGNRSTSSPPPTSTGSAPTSDRAGVVDLPTRGTPRQSRAVRNTATSWSTPATPLTGSSPPWPGSRNGASPPLMTPGSSTDSSSPNAPNTSQRSPEHRLTARLCTPASPESSNGGNRKRDGSGMSSAVSTGRSPRQADFARSAPTPGAPNRGLLAARDATDEQLRTVQEKLRGDRTIANRVGCEVDAHARWVQANQWRQVDLDRIDRQLADHWTDTVLAAVSQDDPLAYGLDRLRGARAVLVTRQGTNAERDLQAVDHALGQARVARIRGIAAGTTAPEHLTSRLGPMPGPHLARDTWCGLALQIERSVDRGLTSAATGSHLGVTIVERLARHGSADPLGNARAVIAAAHAIPELPGTGTPDGPNRWLHAVELATDTQRAIEQQRSRELHHDLGLSL